MPLTPQDLASGNYQAALSTAADASGQQALLFNAESIAGQASSAYATASDLSTTFANTGVDLTGAQAEAQTQKIAAGLALIPGVGTAIGAALYAITSAGGYAHAGAGACANPPKSSGLGDLKAWPNYTPWSQSAANAAPQGLSWEPGSDPRGSFEELANNTLAYNRALMDNCFQDAPAPVLLAQIIAAWNGTHSGPARTISRRIPGGNIGDTAPGYDPIAFALDTAGGSAAANKVMHFTVNGGPPIPKSVTLHLAPNAIISSADGVNFKSTPVASSIGSTIAIGALIAVGVGALGIGAYSLIVHQSYSATLRGIWRSTGGRVVRKVNPLPMLAAATVARSSSQSTTVQTLLFPRPRYSERRAKAWARGHNFIASKTDITANYIRLRQRLPGAFKKDSLRTVKFGSSGIRAVVGHLR